MTDTGTPELVDRLAEMPEWLTAPSEPGVVAGELTAVVPELADGSLRITECEPKLRLKAERAGWAVSYDLALVDPKGAEEEVRLSGTFRPPGEGDPPGGVSEGPFPCEGWSGRLPALGLDLGRRTTGDEALPALGALTDPEAARKFLQGAIRAGSRPGIAIRSVRPDVRRYKPGSRCTIFYDIELEPGAEGPRAVVAKTYRGDKGRNAYTGMQALWDAGISQRGAVTLAEPLAYLPELRVLVQGPVGESQTLKELARAAVATGGSAVEELRSGVIQTAAGLAELHASGVRHGETVTWRQELGDVEDLLVRLRPALPEVASAVVALLGRLEPVDRSVPPDPTVPSHRSFRPAQVLLHDGRIAFIDFDGLCMAEPALDVALFRASLRDAGTRGLAETGRSALGGTDASLDVLDGICDDFTSSYAARVPISTTRVALWESLHLLTSVLHCWTKVKPERLRTRIAILRRHLASTEILGAGSG